MAEDNDELKIVTVPRDLYYHEVAYVRGIKKELADSRVKIERLQMALDQGRISDQCVLDEAIKAATKAKDAEIERMRQMYYRENDKAARLIEQMRQMYDADYNEWSGVEAQSAQAPRNRPYGGTSARSDQTPGIRRNWPRYAEALDLYLAGATLGEIAQRFEVTRSRAQQMVVDAKAQLAFRVFKNLSRPLLRKPSYER